MMRTEEHRPVLLSEYRPPDWLVETVNLDFKLDPTQTPVRATLKLKPNPDAQAPAPLVFDGDGLSLVSVKIDGQLLPTDRYSASPDRLTIAQHLPVSCPTGDLWCDPLGFLWLRRETHFESELERLATATE